MKQHNLDKILDDYFYGVCYKFYQRQMHIWILLRHKYLRTASVGIEDRRFLFSAISGDKGAADQQQKATATFPILFLQSESEPIITMT